MVRGWKREVSGLIHTELLLTVIPKPLGDALTQAVVRLRKYKNVRIGTPGWLNI